MITCYIYKEEFTYGVRVFTRKNSTKIKVQFIAMGYLIAESDSWSLSKENQTAFISNDSEAVKRAIKDHFLDRDYTLGMAVWNRIEQLKK